MRAGDRVIVVYPLMRYSGRRGVVVMVFRDKTLGRLCLTKIAGVEHPIALTPDKLRPLRRRAA